MSSSIKYITKDSLKNTLIDVGLQEGDIVLVHSDISSFGTVENFSKKEVLNIFYEAFMEVLGDEGTLCVPAFFYEYARKSIPFDTELSPVSKEIGVFSSFLNKIKGRKRSPNPLTSIVAIGKNADYICEHVNRHSYGEDSAFDRLYKLNAKIIVMGVPYQTSLTFGHYVEYRTGVPYNYTKFYDIPVYSNGKLVFDSTYASVRYLDCNVKMIGESHNFSLQNNTDSLVANNIAVSKDYLYSKIYLINSHKLFDFTKNKLMKDTYCMLAEKPNFEKGRYPFK